MWMWPMAKFWQYTPLQYALVLLWNFCEYFHIKLPYAFVIFGIICGKKSKRKE